MDYARGIDVSHYQGTVNWQSVFDDGIAFVGIKCSQGLTHMDPLFTANRAGARSMPFALCSFYHFATPGDPVAQANHFLDLVGPLLPNERLVCDLEDDKTGKPEVDLAWADTFYQTLLGGACSDRRPLIYTSRRVWLQLGNPAWDLASEIDLWAPRYGPDAPEPPKPWINAGWKFWQYSETEIVPGVNGACDASRFYGDLAALQAYAQLTTPQAP